MERKAIKISNDTYRRIKYWKNVDEPMTRAVNRLLKEYFINKPVECEDYVVKYHDIMVKFRVIDDDVKYYCDSDDTYQNNINAWLIGNRGSDYVNVVEFFDNFMLKKSAFILLEDMGDELVYGDFVISRA